MNKVSIKPLSVNDAWQGRRFKTPAYKLYERNMLTILPRIKVPDGYIELIITFGLSNKNSDIDNCLKPFIDCLQKKYGFNDNKIKRLVVTVDNSAKKGGEYIDFIINTSDH